MNKLVILSLLLLAACAKQAAPTPSVMDLTANAELFKAARTQCDAALVASLTGADTGGANSPSKELCANVKAAMKLKIDAVQFGGCASNNLACLEAYYSSKGSKLSVSPTRNKTI